jgi:hypothetical protein
MPLLTELFIFADANYKDVAPTALDFCCSGFYVQNTVPIMNQKGYISIWPTEI